MGFKELVQLFHQVSGFNVVQVNSPACLLSCHILYFCDEIFRSYIETGLDKNVVHEMSIQLLKITHQTRLPIPC